MMSPLRTTDRLNSFAFSGDIKVNPSNRSNAQPVAVDKLTDRTYPLYKQVFSEVGVEPDYDRMIEKFLTNKLKMLLEPMNREHILEQNQAFNIFFGG